MMMMTMLRWYFHLLLLQPQGIPQCRRCSCYLANLLLRPARPCQKVSRQRGKKEKEATEEKEKENNNNKYKICQFALETRADWKGNRLLLARWLPGVFVIDFSDDDDDDDGSPAPILLLLLLLLLLPSSCFKFRISIQFMTFWKGNGQLATGNWQPLGQQFPLLLLLPLLLISKSTQYGKLWRFLLDLCFRPSAVCLV